MATSYNVKVWSLQTRYKKTAEGKRVPMRYIVRWRVEKDRFDRTFKMKPQADSFRSDLISAAKRGEAFDVSEGLPLAMLRVENTKSWFEFACAYVDMKWEGISPKYRSSIADSMIAATFPMLIDAPGKPDGKLVSRALRWAFNRARRNSGYPSDIADVLQWVEHNARAVGELAEPSVFRSVMAALEINQNGKRAAHDTIRSRRTTFRNSLEFAVEEKLFLANPMVEFKVKKHKTTVGQVDKRSVVNPVQVRVLLQVVRDLNPRLVAFFALMYFAALRPEEAVNLKRRNLAIPEPVRDKETGDLVYGWGEIHLEKATPEIGAEWTDSGSRSEERGLKHREDDSGRTVPCSSELTQILREHLTAYGTAADGRLFRGDRSGGQLSSTVYGRTWAKARTGAFVPEVVDSPLAKRPYDLRHAAVSTWLNATGDPVRVAEWAGHSVAVLLRVYAKCIHGGEQHAREQVARRLLGA